MASLARLLLFCEFLECRVHTSNLSLLRRMLSDFYAGNEHTLNDFMRLGASAVAVMPLERTGPRQAEARRLLSDQKGRTTQDCPVDVCVFRYLSARVATKNILWLRDMFQEFCEGGDEMVREFIRRGNEPISVLPVDIQALCMVPLPPPPLMMETVLRTASRTQPEISTTSSETNPLSTLSSPRKRARQSEPELQTENREAGTAARSPSVDEVRSSIINALQRIEAKEPWKEVFQRTHGPHTQRRCRQSNSQTFFEKKVIIPVYKELGTSFFVDMDRRHTRHSGWYYNDQPVDLYTLALRYGLPACLKYMESEALKRFPVLPGVSRNFNSSTNGKSLTMWSSSTRLKPLLRAIILVKASE
ncbi:Hypothetical protein PHPALM_37962 [Phytophthora palmivora]|uniref:Uncharacterized protein n=1 Tax=Phytophthora palmivora TaxID=4796 RepID=A0A2P4WW31_9STRA|nr:Hypothetical protein PHPALM_37962 [Phytophthora palmivora]